MILGLVAGFGEPLGSLAWAEIAALGFRTVRTGLGPEATDDQVGTMCADLVDMPVEPLILLTRQRIDSPDGQQVAAEDLAVHALRTIWLAEERGLDRFAVQLGNEGDLSAYWDDPAALGRLTIEVHKALRAARFAGTVVAPSVSNLSNHGLTYAEGMIAAGLSSEVAIAIHVYPPRGYQPRPGGDDRTELWERLAWAVRGRRVWVTEFGQTTAEGLTDAQATTGLLWRLHQFAQHGIERAYLYQHRDAEPPSTLNRYGIMDSQGALKDQAALPVLWQREHVKGSLR